MVVVFFSIFFFKQKTAYEMRISDWSSDVCSSDLLLSWDGRAGRQAWWGVGNWLEFDLAVRPGPMALRALYWGEETNKDFVILIDGTQIAEERRAGPPSKAFVARDYPIPVALTRGKAKVRVRIEIGRAACRERVGTYG